MTKDQEEYVTFENSLGETISNDPRWLAEQTLAAAGVGSADKDAEIAELKAKLEAIESATVATASSDDDDVEDDDEVPTDESGARTYTELDGKALKALANERQVNISGLKKVGEVRKALIAADAEK